MIHIIFLASGSSRRFGTNKLLYELDGKPIFRYGLDLLRDLTLSRVDCTATVVSRYAEIRAAAEQAGLRAVDSPQSEQGISYSIRAGLEALPALQPEDFLLFLVADQPRLTRETIDRMIDAARPGVLLGMAVWKDQAGNPAFFSALLFDELYALSGDCGGRAVIRRHEADCLRIPVTDPRELSDVDTPATLQNID